MSDDESETHFFGTALPELPNDVIPTRKPITVADQIAVDANGKRRFHGAFTGGFSAGYWNTVGSKEGWKPQEFKSSRTDKAAQRAAPTASDFMDDEDCGEFGIAPQRIQTTTDFTTTSTGAGERQASSAAAASHPMLNLFLAPARDRCSVALLKRMGWRENRDGQSHRSQSSRKAAAKPPTKVYQVSMGPFQTRATHSADDDDHSAAGSDGSASDSDESVTFNPDDFDAIVHVAKTNRFGLGYRGLDGSDRSTILDVAGADGGRHLNLFAPTAAATTLGGNAFEVVDRRTKRKLNIRGQAFGVGAFEEEDDDIYAADDMSRYQFDAKRSRAADGGSSMLAIGGAPVKYAQTIEGFKPADEKTATQKPIQHSVSMPRDFRPRNWLQRRSRFEPLPADSKLPSAAERAAAGGRHAMTPDQRGAALGASNTKLPPAGAAPPTAAAAIKPAVSESARKMLESFDKRFVSTAATETPATATLKTGLQDITELRLAEIYNKQFAPATGGDAANNSDTSRPDAAEAKPATDDNAPPADHEVHMTRSVLPWQPCPLLFKLMNIEDPAQLAASRSGGNQSAAPFSLLKHVNPLYRSTLRATEKEFTASRRTDDVDEVQLTKGANAYVPKVHVTLVEPLPPAPSSSSAATSERSTAPIMDRHVPPKPRTELELSISKTAGVHPAEKRDIFKAIFESSGDEDDDNDNDEKRGDNPPATAPPSLPALVQTVNILRNTSPPRGIFSSLPAIRATIEERKKPPAAAEATPEPPPNLYGPTLPAGPPPAAPAADRWGRRRSPSTSSSDSDEWIVADPATQTGKTADRRKSTKSHRKEKKHSKHKSSKSKKSKKCKKDRKHKR